MKIILAVLCLLLVSNQSFAASTTFKCTYPLNATPNNEGNIVVGSDDFSLLFLIDMEAGNAFMQGNNGSNEVMFLPQANGFTLLEMTGIGNVMTTTIARSMTGPMKSVHSRHPIVPAGDEPLLIPSQYYGSCQIK